MKKLVDQNSSFEEMYNHFHNGMVTWLTYKIKSKSDAEEIANDSLIKVFEKLDTFDESKSTFSTWVANICRNTLIDYTRKQKTVKGMGMRNREDIDAMPSNDCPVFQVPDKGIKADSLFDTQIVAKNIEAAINSLKGNYKAIAIELFINQLSYDEIAEKLGLSLGTVKPTILRIREKLQNKLQKEYELVC